MDYKFLKLMSNAEIKILLADYGNATGAEINNFLVRELISMIKSNADHSILIKLENYLAKISIELIKAEVAPYLGDYSFDLDSNELISIIRENKNRIYQNDAKKKGLTSFIGNCKKHSHGQFSIRGEYHFCNECYQTGMSKNIFHPIRNLILKLFVKKHNIPVNSIAKELGIASHYVCRYHKEASTIPSERWEAISALILKVEGND